MRCDLHPALKALGERKRTHKIPAIGLWGNRALEAFRAREACSHTAMKSLYPILVAGILPFGATTAQDEEKKIDLDVRKRSVSILAEHIEDREQRLADIASDIMRLDQRLETQIDRVVKKLGSIKDSQKSGFRVSQIKMDAMEGLAKTIENYQSKRAALIQEIREGRSGIPKEVLAGDARKFDEHIEKRVEQIMKISKSFTQNADVKKYEKVHGSDYYTLGIGWSDEIEKISEEWRQNRRDRTMDKKQRSEILEALKKSIERYESLIAGQKESLANRRMSKSERSLMQSELNRNLQTLDARKGFLDELLEVDVPATDAVGPDAAQDLQLALRDAAADMRQDFETIFVKYGELNRERSKVFALKKKLDAGIKWIQDYEAGLKK